MKQKHLLGAGMLLTALLWTGCSDDTKGLGNSYGTFTPVIGLDTRVDDTPANRAGAELTVNDLSLKLTKPDGSVSTWDKVTDFDSQTLFPIGAYTLEAYYGDEANEGFDYPYYYGTASFKVLEDQRSEVSLTATLANSILSVEYTDNFTGYMQEGSWSASAKSSTGKLIDIPGDETRLLYLKSGAVSVNVTFTKPNGKTGTFEAATFRMDPRKLYHVIFDVDAGNSKLNVSFDDSMTEETVEIDISDEVFNAAAPEIIPQGFESGVPVEFIDSSASDMELSTTLMAMGTIKSVNLSFTSDYLTGLLSPTIPGELELVGATEAQKAILATNGIEVTGLWKNLDKMALIDFSKIANNVPAGQHTFTITLTDALGRVTEPTQLILNPQPLTLSIEAIGKYLVGYDTELSVKYNGKDFAKDVQFEYHIGSGAETPLAIKSFRRDETAEDAHTYIVTLATAALNEPSILVHARCSKKISNELSLVSEPAQFKVVVDPNDVFAYTAKASVAALPDATDQLPALSECTFLLRKAGTLEPYKTLTPSGDVLNIGKADLAPATQYEICAQANGKRTASTTFTTETAQQLVNGNLDAPATSSASGSPLVNNFTWNCYEFQGWSTLNKLTTSEPGDDSFANTAYKCNSGTIPFDEDTNIKGVIIRTLGWGGGNNASDLFRKCQHITPGELFLGTFKGISNGKADVSYGISFDSRPLSVSFSYKYIAYNSNDYGTVLIEIQDANGNVLAESYEQNLYATDSFTTQECKLVYKPGDGKAAKLIITFKSSGHPDAIVLNKNWITYPVINNYDEYRGSELYIDDVNLNYIPE